LNFKHKVVQTTLYYKNGVKLNEPEIIHGDGKYTFCNPDGQVCCECEIKNGKIKNCHPIK
jgi:antitoxin component YwqK of YwqJK toxin-antitoxin module